MTLFVVIAVVLAALSLAFVLPPLLRARTGGDVDRARANLGVLQDQLRELEADHARGVVADAQYAEIKAELERRVLEDVQGADAPAATRRGARWPAAVVAVAVPVLAVGIYAKFGDPGAFDAGLQAASRADSMEGHASGEQLEQMVVSLRQRLQQDADNADGWLMLARTLYQMRKFDEAAKAYEKVVALVDDDAGVLADYADAAAMAQGRKFDGKPRELVARALKLDPTQWKALAMAGTDAFEQGDFKQAIARWEQLRAQLPPDAPISQSISSSIAEARERAGLPPEVRPLAKADAPAMGGMPDDDVHKRAAKPDAAKPAPAQPGADQSRPAAGGGSLSGTVTLAPALRAKVAPDDTVFIFARPAAGGRMPLALKRLAVKDLPAKFTLDDSAAISPDNALSAQSEVVVGARISKKGSPMPVSGDFEGLTQPVKMGARDLSITIDSVLP